MLLTDYKKAETKNVLLVGMPKGSGKSTTAMTAPGNKLLLQYDLGSPTLPPGVDPSTVFVRTYPPSLSAVKLDSDRWVRPKNVGAEIIDDIFNIREAVLAGRPPVVGKEELPWPLTPGDTIIMDGWVQWFQHILDWILAVNNKANPEDFENRHAAWGKRLNQGNILLNMLLPLPVNFAITTWVARETTQQITAKGVPIEVATGRFVPDLGGKMNIWGPGKVDSSIYLYSEKSVSAGLRFLARVKPNENFQWVGTRGNYSKAEIVDLTIDEKDKRLPWARLFGEDGR